MSPRLGPGSDFTYTEIADADRLHFIYTEIHRAGGIVFYLDRFPRKTSQPNTRWKPLHEIDQLSYMRPSGEKQHSFAIVHSTIFAALRADEKGVIIRI